MKIGYIRISRDKQTTILQEDAMKKEEVERTFTDIGSGKRFDRTEFLKMLEILRPGDVVVVWRLDRLGRSLKNLIETVMLLNTRGVELKSLKESIDTSTSTGKLLFHIIGAMAEFEHDVIVERTIAGLEAARARGRKGGRQKVTSTMSPSKLVLARQLYDGRQHTVAQIMELTGFRNRGTFYNFIQGK